ncbi:LOB domain-containing protein 22-like [Macadamia integrifolia]|uniref:LOB domain-containing protein 22-like n=1 Tax=Macadamia integrifolia TaxID=60698 RepID=UPI001C4F521E|nr:LOB domain-containing protein 22-like [Macadamia integrifolia]
MSSNSSIITNTLINNNNNSNSRGAVSNNGTSSGSGSSTTNTSGSSQQACAACKYQRRKCTPGCTLAPYFPADQQRQFLNAHKLFGVSNILKIIRNLDPSQKDEAMRTMIIQANTRAIDPVGGCYRIIHELQCQIERDKAELQIVLHQLAICRAQAQAHLQLLQQQEVATQAINHHHQDPVGASYITPMLHHQHLQQHNTPPSPSLLHQQQFLVQDNNHQGISQWVMQEDPNPNTNRINDPDNKEPPFMNECEDIKPLLGMFEDRQQSLPFDHKDSIQCSDKAVLKDEEADVVVLKGENNSMEHVPEHDLKGAASLFTLTNCNS